MQSFLSSAAAVLQLLLLMFFCNAPLPVIASSCQNAETYLQSVLQQSGLAYATPTTTSSNKCRLSSTCCTASAESKLETLVETKYETKLYKKLNSTISQCLDSSIQSTAAAFIDEAKALALSSIQNTVTLTIDNAIITEFYDYLKNGILSLELDQLETKFKALYLKVFLATFREILEDKHSLQLVTNEVFETCFYNNVFSSFFGTDMNTDYTRFEERFNLLFRFVWTVGTGKEVLSKVLNHTLSSDCRESLLRMDHCSQCSSQQDAVTSTLTCRSMCLNSLRGCLVDLTVFGSSLDSYVDKLEDANDRLNVFDPFASVNLLSSKLNGIVTTTSASFDTYKLYADSLCNAQYTSSRRRRRNTSSNGNHGNRSKRQSTESVKAYINDAVTCLSRIPNVLKGLSESMCEESTSVSTVDYNCWNGTDIDSYWWTVMDSDRLHQASNPELNIQADTGLQYKEAIGQLNIASEDLEVCRVNVRTCNEKLSSFTSPNGTQYDFADAAEFQSFTQLGFPEPQIASVIPVNPSSHTLSVHVGTTSATPLPSATPISSATPLSSTTMMANMQDQSTTVPTSSHAPVSSPLSSSVPPLVRPTSSRRLGTTSTYTTRPLPTFTPIDSGIPDKDKPSESKLPPERISGTCVGVSVSSTIILLLTTLVIVLTTVLL